MHLIIRIDLILTLLIAVAILAFGIKYHNLIPFYATMILVILVVILALLAWASSMVIINISNNLHNISRLSNKDRE